MKPKHKKIRKYGSRIHRQIVHLLQTPSHRFNQETYHQLRVEIKKWRALCHLLDFLSPKFKSKKALKPFSRLFKQAGKVREIQLEMEWLQVKYPMWLVSYSKQLQKKCNKEEKKFIILAREKSIFSDIKLAKILAREFLSKTNKKMVLAYLLKQKWKIGKMMENASLKPKELHLMRKILKRWEYNRKAFLGNKWEQHATVFLCELLGLWHDVQVVSEHLQKVSEADNVHTEERAELTSILAQLNIQNQDLLRQIALAMASSG